jgi:protein LTV1
MMNEFLDEYEILGGKMKPRLEGDTNIEKLDTIRRALGPVTIRDYDEKDDGEIPIPVDIDDIKDVWDCETILSAFCYNSTPPGAHFRASQQPTAISKTTRD